MRGGTWNLRYGRDEDKVREEVLSLLDKQDLDYLGLQETNDYYHCLRGLPNYQTFTGGSSNVGAHRETMILVRKDHDVSHVANKSFGNGWPGQGFRMRPRTFLRLRIDNRHKVGVIHFPPHVDLEDQLPADRFDDYRDLSVRAANYLSGPSRFTRTLLLDANAHPSNRNIYSPSWIAGQSGATLSAPDNKVDMILTKNLVVDSITKLNHFDEESDHNPVIFESHKER